MQNTIAYLIMLGIAALVWAGIWAITKHLDKEENYGG